MLEAGDINDSEIITKTVQRSLPPHGFAQFVYTLPSGRKICSEAIPPDHMKQALRQWTQAVRDNILQDVEDERKQHIAAARRLQDEKARGALVQDLQETRQPVEAPKRSEPHDVEFKEPDPTEMARTNLERLAVKIELLQQRAQCITNELSDALKAQKRWNRILLAATGEEDV